jgi:hypothetical protein
VQPVTPHLRLGKRPQHLRGAAVQVEEFRHPEPPVRQIG